MRVLLDTCILSECKQSTPHAGVITYLEFLDSLKTCISVITVGEIAYGIQRLKPGKKKLALEQWLNTLESEYAERILPITSEITRIWGELRAKIQQQGRTLPAVDGLIAATAIHHGLHVVTRNTEDFLPTGVLVINPWQLLP